MTPVGRTSTQISFRWNMGGGINTKRIRLFLGDRKGQNVFRILQDNSTSGTGTDGDLKRERFSL